MRRAPKQCAALTKAKKRCSITTESKLATDSGKLAAEPLRRGGLHCLFHAQIFNSMPARVPPHAKVFYLDFETTGLDVISDSIVEIGLLDETGSAVFSTVVRPPVLPSGEPTVHGIAPEELADGPTFAVAFTRLVRFVQNVVEMVLVDGSDSSVGEADDVPALRENPPAVLIAAHNGLKFDVPILFVELLRCGIGLERCAGWYFIDTLDVLRSLDGTLTGGCVELKCLLRRLHACDGLQAHRALGR